MKFNNILKSCALLSIFSVSSLAMAGFCSSFYSTDNCLNNNGQCFWDYGSQRCVDSYQDSSSYKCGFLDNFVECKMNNCFWDDAENLCKARKEFELY